LAAPQEKELMVMAIKNLRLRMSVLLVAVALVASVPAFGGSAVIGSVAGSTNATLGGQALIPNTTIFSGDSLQVKDGVAVVAIGKTSRMVFGRETVASFLRESSEVTVLLSQGNISLYHPDDSVGLRVKAGEVTVVPGKGFKTLGDVAMVNGALVVTAKEGMLRVEGNGPAMEVAKGKTITVLPKAARATGAAAGAGAGAKIAGSTALSVGTLGAGVSASVLSGVAISRANDAKSAAQAANTTAVNAVAAANAAASQALAATTAANAATTAAKLATSTALVAGCSLNKLAFNLGFASPFTPPAGTTPPPGC